jgi:hypothetical protein
MQRPWLNKQSGCATAQIDPLSLAELTTSMSSCDFPICQICFVADKVAAWPHSCPMTCRREPTFESCAFFTQVCRLVLTLRSLLRVAIMFHPSYFSATICDAILLLKAHNTSDSNLARSSDSALENAHIARFSVLARCHVSQNPFGSVLWNPHVMLCFSTDVNLPAQPCLTRVLVTTMQRRPQHTDSSHCRPFCTYPL